MTHKVHPYSQRLPLLRGWQSRWFAQDQQYKKFLQADVLLREFLEKRLRGFYVEGIELERGRNELRIILKTSRPGLIIGRSGEGVVKLRNETVVFLKKRKLEIPKDLRLDIEEVKSPESHARIVGQMIAEGLKRRLPFKRVVRQMLDKVMANREVKGIKVTIAGRLNGADIARSETFRRGRLPLQTLRADIDFAREPAYLPYGVIGIKIWIFRG